jgi:acyl-CoA thioesterase FadM
MRWLRLILALIRSKYRSKIDFTQTTQVSFRVWVTDVDVSIMNHAAFLTVFEVGRIDFMVRSGFFKLNLANKWYSPAQAISVQYFRPLKIFQKAQVFTRISYFDEKWIYMEQKIVSKGKDVAGCLVKGLVKKGKENIDPQKVLSLLGVESFETPKYDLITSYENESNELTNRLKDWEI